MISFNKPSPPKGTTMQIDLSKEDYRTLIEILDVANWVLFANMLEEPPGREKYREFAQKIYTHAEPFGCENLVGYDDLTDSYYSVREFDDSSPVRPFIDEFEDDTFWSELADRLADRDMRQEYSEETLAAMTPEQQFQAYTDFEEQYQDEFEDHGIERLEIVE
jgi:hypothetical protein